MVAGRALSIRAGNQPGPAGYKNSCHRSRQGRGRGRPPVRRHRLWGGIAGALSALVVIFYPVAAGTEYFRYPFEATGFTVAEVFFAVQHVTMVLAVVALLNPRAVGSSRLARIGFLIGLGGLALLAAVEVAAITAVHTVAGEPLYDLVQSLFSIPTIMTGTGFVLGGIGVLRHGGWTGAKRFLPLILGVYVFVPLIPAIMGPQLAGRIAIGIWVLLLRLVRPGTVLDQGGSGTVALSIVPLWALVAPLTGGSLLALDTPRGMFVALHLYALLAVLSIACSFASRTVVLPATPAIASQRAQMDHGA